jgi:hypothetical protein
MDLADFLSIFHTEYEAVFDERFDGDDDLLVEAFGVIDGDFDPQALEAAFVEAKIEDCELWGNLFWEQFSTALEEADV